MPANSLSPHEWETIRLLEPTSVCSIQPSFLNDVLMYPAVYYTILIIFILSQPYYAFNKTKSYRSQINTPGVDFIECFI